MICGRNFARHQGFKRNLCSLVLRPGFEPGSPAIFRYFNGERPEYLVHVGVFNLAILGRKGEISFLLPEPEPEHLCK